MGYRKPNVYENDRHFLNEVRITKKLLEKYEYLYIIYI